MTIVRVSTSPINAWGGEHQRSRRPPCEYLYYWGKPMMLPADPAYANNNINAETTTLMSEMSESK